MIFKIRDKLVNFYHGPSRKGLRYTDFNRVIKV